MEEEKKKRTSKGWIILALIVAILAAGFVVLWNSSLFGKKLPEFSGSQLQTFTPLSSASTSESTALPPADLGIIQEIQTPTQSSLESVCGQKEPMNIVLLGIDGNEQADGIRLIRVDFVQKRILVLSIPRDIWVPVPGMGMHGITESKINATYGYGEYFNGLGQGIVEFSRTIYENYGVTFDHYVVFHKSDVIKLVDRVGGVDINLNGSIGGYDISGYHHLDGKETQAFVEMRDADNDDYRIDRQSLVMNSLFKKLTQPENLVKLPGLGLEILQEKSIITDFSIKDVSTFTCFARALNSDSLVFKDIPGELFTASSKDGLYIRIPSPEMTSYIRELMINGNY